MPVTLRVAFGILGAVTALAVTVLIPLTLFLVVWGGMLGLLPFALAVAYVAVVVLVMLRKSWARFATPLFPVSIAIIAVMVGSEGPIVVLAAVAALSVIAVVLIFAPSSRVYFTPAPSASADVAGSAPRP